jgi:hypothetical protein
MRELLTMIGVAPPTKLSVLRLDARRLRISDWNGVSGTQRLLDAASAPPARMTAVLTQRPDEQFRGDFAPVGPPQANGTKLVEGLAEKLIQL